MRVVRLAEHVFRNLLDELGKVVLFEPESGVVLGRRRRRHPVRRARRAHGGPPLRPDLHDRDFLQKASLRRNAGSGADAPRPTSGVADGQRRDESRSLRAWTGSVAAGRRPRYDGPPPRHIFEETPQMANAYIIDTCRTPRGIGKQGKGALSHLHSAAPGTNRAPRAGRPYRDRHR